jgi:flagellar basal body-associated protein FliL
LRARAAGWEGRERKSTSLTHGARNRTKISVIIVIVMIMIMIIISGYVIIITVASR